MTNHYQVANRWAKVVTGQTKKPLLNDSRGSVNVGRDTDVINSFGWWEMARLQRDRKGNPVRFLINGDNYSQKTSQQQSVVRGAIAATGLPSFILPYSVLDEAGIDRATVTPIHVTDFTTESTRHDYMPTAEQPLPSGAVWQYTHDKLPGTGVYVHRVTGEAVESEEYDKRTRKDAGTWDHDAEGGWDDYYARMKAAEAQWIEYPYVSKVTGHKELHVRSNGWATWQVVANDESPTGYSFTRETLRHWLGESLVSASVSYWERDKTTGIRHPKTRKARFLSGFDHNESRMSYFFCELPRSSKALTVAEALEDLKPATVKTAETMGRKVERQGDIFGVPLSLDAKELTRQGAAKSKGAYILGTNHCATEVATLGKLTFARGTLKHAPQGRRPDHARVKLGDGKQWHLVLKNTVPVTA